MGPGGGQGQTDSTASFFWLMLLIILIILVIWWLKRAWFVAPVFFLRQIELSLLKFFAEAFGDLAKALNIPMYDVDTVGKLEQVISTADPSTISKQKLLK